ncbi:MAG: hypothetical protein ACOYVD_17860 [Bacillota bacterium]
MYKTVTNFVNSPEYLMLSSQERQLKEEELRKQDEATLTQKNNCD